MVGIIYGGAGWIDGWVTHETSGGEVKSKKAKGKSDVKNLGSKTKKYKRADGDRRLKTNVNDEGKDMHNKQPTEAGCFTLVKSGL